MQTKIEYIIPNWSSPSNIKALTTTRHGGFSKGDFATLNLSYNTNDNHNFIAQNRQKLVEDLLLPGEPLWLNQVHESTVLKSTDYFSNVDADAIYTNLSNTVLAIQTADCLPIILTDDEGSYIIAIHAGWRGLAKNIIAKSLMKVDIDNKKMMAWIGPCISQKNYQVGTFLFETFYQMDSEYKNYFQQEGKTHYRADLTGIASYQLRLAGVNRITSTNLCTYENSAMLYSYRRSPNTGRQATLIWKTK